MAESLGKSGFWHKIAYWMNTIFLLFCCCLSISLSAQKYYTEFFDKDGKPVSEAKSAYFVIGKYVWLLDVNNDTILSYVDTVRAYYTQTKSLKFIKIYDKKGVQNGDYIEYYPNRKISKQGKKSNGLDIGYAMYNYANGKKRATIQFLPKTEKGTNCSETDFKILSYRDTTGSEIVKLGNGYCYCQFDSDEIVVGKVVDGLRDSIWSEYLKGTLIVQETYNKGDLSQGTRYHQGNVYNYMSCNEPPHFMGGTKKLLEVIRKNMRYPASARRMGIDGTVYVEFTVRTDGTIENPKVTKGIAYDCDMEALRVVKLTSGEWVPGMIRGVPVEMLFSYPIKYKLN
jgi:TonB family protein